jgi:hypothetical protein
MNLSVLYITSYKNKMKKTIFTSWVRLQINSSNSIFVCFVYFVVRSFPFLG